MSRTTIPSPILPSRPPDISRSDRGHAEQRKGTRNRGEKRRGRFFRCLFDLNAGQMISRCSAWGAISIRVGRRKRGIRSSSGLFRAEQNQGAVGVTKKTRRKASALRAIPTTRITTKHGHEHDHKKKKDEKGETSRHYHYPHFYHRTYRVSRPAQDGADDGEGKGRRKRRSSSCLFDAEPISTSSGVDEVLFPRGRGSEKRGKEVVSSSLLLTASASIG